MAYWRKPKAQPMFGGGTNRRRLIMLRSFWVREFLCNFKPMREVKQSLAPLTVEEYIQLELQSERRHEFINGQLIEMPGEKDINNEVAGFIYACLLSTVRKKGFQVYINDVKLATPDKKKYYYPDVFITREAKTDENRYIKYEPELIVEVVSPSTYITDTVDKYLAYTAIPSVKYYLLVQPEITYVTLFLRAQEGEWEAAIFNQTTDVISLPLLELELPLSEVYR